MLLCGALLAPATPARAADEPSGAGSIHDQRAQAEKRSKSRYRRFEVVSLVVILAAGGGLVLWAIRRK